MCGDKYLFNFLKTFLSTNLDSKLDLVLIFKGQSIKIALMAIKIMLRSLYNYLFLI